MQENRLKCLAIVIASAVVYLVSRNSAAQTSCVNDVDCPTATCGGQVCDWNMGLTCQPAGNAAKGVDGWCETTANCKCRDLGAVCISPYCTFTLASQAPGGGTGGATAGTGGAGAGTGGRSGTGGAAATDAGTTPKDDGGGCSIGHGPAPTWPAGIALLAIALGVYVRRRA